MSRIARLVIPNLPHHVTQRGNGRQKVFFDQADYVIFRDMDYGDTPLNYRDYGDTPLNYRPLSLL